MKFFVKSIFSVLTVILLCLAFLYVFAPTFPFIAEPLIAGIILALVFVSTGFFTFQFAIRLKENKFTFIILGTTIGRLVLLLAILSIIIRFSIFNAKIIIVSMLCSYFVFQIIEVVSFTKINPKEI
jgi:hypothetical protein